MSRSRRTTASGAGTCSAWLRSAAQGVKDVGTIPQYRRLLQLEWPRASRPFKLADRVLFRLLSRDEDPSLLFEFQKAVKADPEAEAWARGIMREAASAALAEAGHAEDPRLRGAGHKIASAISQFLRSPLAEKPFLKSGKQIVLHPEAHPPSWYSVAMLASMPNLQRERAGFTERLGHYLAQPAPKKAFVIQVGKKTVKPQHLILGDPIEADAKGVPKDIPLALHYIELMARMGALEWAPVATKVLARLLKDMDDAGIWAPKNLRSQPKAGNKITHHYYPLHLDAKTTEGREVDITFRLALIGKALGWTPDLHLSSTTCGQGGSMSYYYRCRELTLPALALPRPKASSTRFCSPTVQGPAMPLPGQPAWLEPTPTARWRGWWPRARPGSRAAGPGSIARSHRPA